MMVVIRPYRRGGVHAYLTVDFSIDVTEEMDHTEVKALAEKGSQC